MASAGALAEVERLEQLQDLRHRDAARCRRSHAADAQQAIDHADGVALFHAIAGEIGQRDVAVMIGRLLDGVDDALRHRAGVERVGAALGDGSQGLRRTRGSSADSRPARRCRSCRRNSAAPPGRSSGRPASAAAGADAARRRSRRSASLMAGANSRAQGRRPCCLCRVSSRRSAPGTPTLRPPKTASSKGRGRPSTRKRSGVAAAGALSRPS